MAMEDIPDISISPPKRLKLDEGFHEKEENSFKMNAGTLDVEKDIEEGANNSESVPLADTEKLSLPFTRLETSETNEDENSNDADKNSTKSNCSSVSDISCFSNLSGQQWKPTADALTINWLEQQMLKGANPRVIFNELTGDDSIIPETMSDFAIWKVIFSYLMEPPVRKRLRRITTLDHAIHLIRSCSKILVLTGAGVSVSCGIPDFRSKDGVYARLAVDFPDLPDPQSMFDISYFHRDPRPFFKFAKEIYPGQFKPSPCHRFIKHLEKQKKLLRNYTQNIDTLERVADIQNVVECHGSFATASCTVCGHKVSSDEIKEEIFQQKIPYCTKCAEGVTPGIMKPDIVFFGEGLPASFHDAMGKDKDECDLLIVIGSSLKVQPVALIPSSLPSEVPQILINRERLHMNFDVELLGDSDVIVDHICRNLEGDWNELCWRDSPLSDCTDLLPPKTDTSESSSDDSSSSSSHQSDEEESPVDNAEVKCQKIGKRHVASDDNARHMSLDSSRDSGIGESSSNSNDSPISLTPNIDFDNSFFRLRKRRYVFPGAEVPGPHIAIFKKPLPETHAS